MAAHIAVAGMDPIRFLKVEDQVEGIIMISIMQRWFKLREQLDEQLAVKIINTLSKSMKPRGGGTGAY